MCVGVCYTSVRSCEPYRMYLTSYFAHLHTLLTLSKVLCHLHSCRAPQLRNSTELLFSGIKRQMFVQCVVEASWNVMALAQKPDFVFHAKRTSPFKSAGGRQFSRLLAAEACASAVIMLDTPCSEVGWRVLANHSFRQFPLHFLSQASPCAITFQLESTVISCSINICIACTCWVPISRHWR